MCPTCQHPLPLLRICPAAPARRIYVCAAAAAPPRTACQLAALAAPCIRHRGARCHCVRSCWSLRRYQIPAKILIHEFLSNKNSEGLGAPTCHVECMLLSSATTRMHMMREAVLQLPSFSAATRMHAAMLPMVAVRCWRLARAAAATLATLATRPSRRCRRPLAQPAPLRCPFPNATAEPIPTSALINGVGQASCPAEKSGNQQCGYPVIPAALGTCWKPATKVTGVGSR